MFGDKSSGKTEDAIKTFFSEGLNKFKDILGDELGIGDRILMVNGDHDISQKLNSIKEFDENASVSFLSPTSVLLKTKLTGAQVKVLMGSKDEPLVVKFQPIGQKTAR